MEGQPGAEAAKALIIFRPAKDPGVGLRDPWGEAPWAHMTILNVIHLPGEKAATILEDVSSVNASRLVFDGVSETDLDLLPDRTYPRRGTIRTTSSTSPTRARA
jgi:hypothetical protein